jgi:xanthine dehydrogenase molybdopterin-binding subunit B
VLLYTAVMDCVSNSFHAVTFTAADKVEYVGQPIALLVATTQAVAQRAAALVSVRYSQPPAGQTPILTVDQAVAAGAFYDNATLMAVAASRDACKSSSTLLVRPPDSNKQQQQQQDCGNDSSSSGNEAVAAAAAVEAVIAAAPHQIRGGRYSLPAQQHMAMETQVRWLNRNVVNGACV